MQARFYLPWVGRFGSPDPARDQHFEQTQSWNIYSYVQNSPTMQTDPTGMVTEFAEPDPDPDPDGHRGHRTFDQKTAQKDSNIDDHEVKKGQTVNKVDAGFAEGRSIPNDQAIADVAQALENGKEAHREGKPSEDADKATTDSYAHVKKVIETVKPAIDGDTVFFVMRKEGSGATVGGVIPKGTEPAHTDKFDKKVKGKSQPWEVAFWRRNQQKKAAPKPHQKKSSTPHHPKKKDGQ